MNRLISRDRTTWMLAGIAFVLVALVAASPAPKRDVIPKGADLWTTAGGYSYTSFASDPLPADFFCPGSKPFTGRIRMRGERLIAEPASGVGNTDTIVSRLDDAVFDRNGVARTRIRFLALSLTSMEKLVTECGAYDVTIRLEGEQPTTEMKIVRTASNGGTYEDSISFHSRIVFHPVQGNPHGVRAVSRRVDFGPGKNAHWSFQPAKRPGRVRVDTDGDRMVDTLLPPPTSFAPSVAPASSSSSSYCQRQTCHMAPSGEGESSMHCVNIWVPCEDDPEPTPTPTPTPTPPPSASGR